MLRFVLRNAGKIRVILLSMVFLSYSIMIFVVITFFLKQVENRRFYIATIISVSEIAHSYVVFSWL